MDFREAIQREIDRDRAYRIEKGYPFSERTPDKHTIGDFICAVMAIDNEADARQFYQSYIDFLENQPDRKQPAKYVADANIGWCFGEGMSPERKAIWCKCTTASLLPSQKGDEMTHHRMRGKELWVCRVHRRNEGSRCLSCDAAMRFNLFHAYCECGEPATGYRTIAANEPVEFFCDTHFQAVEQAGEMK